MQRKPASSASELSDQVAAKVRFRFLLKLHPPVTGLAKSAARQRFACRDCERMLRQRKPENQGRFCPPTVSSHSLRCRRCSKCRLQWAASQYTGRALDGGLGPSVKTAPSFTFLRPRRLPARLRVRRQDIGRCCPSWYGQAEVELRADCQSSGKSVRLLSGAWNAYHTRSVPVRSILPSLGPGARIAVSKCAAVRGSVLAKETLILSSAALPST
jgi:hypothetical protein